MNQTTVQVKSYRKKCKTCIMETLMSTESGKWRALDTSGTTAHACQLNERLPARPVLSPTVEKTATENVQQILRFDTDVTELLYKQLIAALREVSYSLNTTVVSTLALDQASTKRVLERVKRQEPLAQKTA